MKRRLQVLAICMAVLLAMRLMAQDNSGGGGGDTGGGGDNSGGTDNSGGGTTSPDNSGGTQNGNGGSGGSEEGTSQGGTGGQGNGGTGNGGTGTGGTENGGTGTGGESTTPTEGTGGEGTTTPLPPPTGLPPGLIEPVPGTTPIPTLAPFNAASAATQGAVQTPPVSFSLPGGYGGSSGQSFTLGQGRLAKPFITFTTAISQGYDSNVFDAPSHFKVVPTPTPFPLPTPPLERRIIGFDIDPPLIQPVYQYFRPKQAPTPALPRPVQPLGVIGSPVSTLTLGVQIQKGTPRTVFTFDISLGAQEYWNQPGQTLEYNGNFDLSFLHRITPRATFSIEANAVYQNTPNFALINAPTVNGSGGSYFNATIKGDLSYTWTSRFSTISSYSLNTNLLQNSSGDNLYASTYGTQFRYTVSARNTVTAEIRLTTNEYPTNASANNDSLFYLVGLDSFITARLRNTFSVGLETNTFSQRGVSQTLPYFESATTLGLPRGGSLQWTNRFGSEETGSPDATAESYRTGLSLSQPISTKLVASLSLAYNYFVETDSLLAAAGYTQNQIQASVSMAYNLSPRLALSLSYTYIELLTTQLNVGYYRQQIFLGGNYTFR